MSYKLSIILCLSIVFFPIAVCAKSSTALIIAVEQNASLADWNDPNYPAFHNLLDHASIGLYNTRTKSVSGPTPSFDLVGEALTISSGSRCAGITPSPTFQPLTKESSIIGVPIRSLFERRTGIAPEESSMVSVQWAQVSTANNSSSYPQPIGELSKVLRLNGIGIVADGSALANILAADQDGILHGPAAGSKGVLRIVDLGNHSVLADSKLGQVARNAVAVHVPLVIMSLSPNANDVNAEYHLAPLAILSASGSPALLRSATTRRNGVIANTDICATVLNLLGLPHAKEQLGSPAFPVSSANPNAYLLELDRTEHRQSAAQHYLPIMAIAIGLCFLLLCLARNTPWSLPAAILPVAFVFASLIAGSTTAWIAVALPATIVLVSASLRWGIPYTITATAAAMSAVIGYDMLSGSQLLSSSVIGYSYSEGARYYGIGNEAYGLFLGALLGLSAFNELSPRGSAKLRLIAAGLLTAGVLVSALPQLGAKGGDVLVGVPVIGYLAARLCNLRLGIWTVAGAAVTAVGLLAVVATVDLLHGGANASHLGRIAAQTRDTGVTAILNEAGRKLSIELRGLTHSAWMLPFWVGVITLVRTAARQRKFGTVDPWLGTALVCVVSLAAFNDAGAVAASLAMVMLVPWALQPKKAMAQMP